MKTRTLGKQLKVSAIGLGSMSMTGSVYGSAPERSEMIRPLRDAHERGAAFSSCARRQTMPTLLRM